MLAWRRVLVLLLLPALLLAQALGLAHGLAHARPGTADAAIASKADRATPLDALFAGHDRGSCRLYDQLSHGDQMPVLPVLTAPLPPAVLMVVALQGLALARWAALFDARGPPVLR